MTSTATLINNFWGPDNMDPKVWTHGPRNCGIPGVSFPISQRMKNWDSLCKESVLENLGRKVSVSTSDVDKFVASLQRNGIKVDKEPVYYDVDTNERIDGELRYRSSMKLGISAWMMQPVKFQSLRAKRKFALVINNNDQDINRDNTIQDVEATILDLMEMDSKEGIEINSQWIKSEVEDCTRGSGTITARQRENLISSLILGLQRKTGTFVTATRYVEWRRSLDHYVKDQIEQYEQDGAEIDQWILDHAGESNTLYLEEYTWSAIMYKILEKLETCLSNKKAMNLLFAVDVPNNPKSTFDLFEKRTEIFTKRLAKLEDQLMVMNQYFHREDFPWNYADAQHRFLSQDSTNESPRTLVYVPNRTFN